MNLLKTKLNWQDFEFQVLYCVHDRETDVRNSHSHDDYYEHYGIEYIQIDEMYVGLATASEDTRVRMSAFALEGWGNDVTYHERLKESYYILQNYWAELDG